MDVLVGRQSYYVCLLSSYQVCRLSYLEVKKHLNKSDQSYPCELLKRGAGYVILRYVNTAIGQVAGVTFEVGSTTFAWYQDGCGYVLWKMYGQEGKLEGHLFHICKDLNVGKSRVEYQDLLLDVWVDCAGQVMVLDREELADCVDSGLVSEEDQGWIVDQERVITEAHDQLIGEFGLLLK